MSEWREVAVKLGGVQQGITVTKGPLIIFPLFVFRRESEAVPDLCFLFS